MTIINATGQTIANFVVTELEEGQVRSLLPKHYTSHSNKAVFLFSEQRNPGPSILGYTPFRLKELSREFILGIPYVTVPGSKELFSHLPILYLDNFKALALGILCYGVNKKPSSIISTDNKFEVPFLISASFSQLGDKIDPNSPEFSSVREILELPFASRYLGRDISANFDWQFDNAEIRTLEAEVRTYNFPGLQGFSFQGQGYRLTGEWKLSLPKLV